MVTNRHNKNRQVRLRRMSATALGLYMAARLLGHDGEVQKHRLKLIGEELKKYNSQSDRTR